MKQRILAFVFAALTALPVFAHDDPTGMHISTKSPKAHALFEEAMSKIELLHVQAGLESLRKSVQADPHFALGHIMLTFFSEDPAEQVRERDKALATRQYAGPEEQMIIDWLANANVVLRHHELCLRKLDEYELEEMDEIDGEGVK